MLTLVLPRSSAKSRSPQHYAARQAVSLLSYNGIKLLTFIETDVAPEILENTKHRKYTRAVDVWSLGVVLYICLCGFPPFSDELYSPDNPYTLAQQIKMGKFDYPSPYWDSVGDPALDLIDRMMTVDINQRITIDECLEHPWITRSYINPADSTDGLTGAMGGLDFSKRKLERQRTLLSAINDVKVSKVVDVDGVNGAGAAHVKVFEKNPEGKEHFKGRSGMNGAKDNQGTTEQEKVPAANRDPQEFVEMGGKGDQVLFGDDNASRYLPAEVPKK